MANLQVRLDDSLKAKAQTVAEGMGMDLSSAVRIFLAQMVRENGLPFTPSNDPFYSAKNRQALSQSLSQVVAGETVEKSMAELRSLE